MKKSFCILCICIGLTATISCSKPANDKQSRNNEAVKSGDTSEQSAGIKQEKAETPVGLRDRRPEADEAAGIEQEKAETPVGLRDRRPEADKLAGVKQKTAKKEAPAPVRYAFVLRRKEQIIHITIDLANQKVLYEWGDSASKSHLPWINRYVPVSRIMNEQKAADIIKIMKQFQIRPEYGFITEKSDLEQM